MKVFHKSALMTRATQKLTAMVVIPTIAIGLALGASSGAHGGNIPGITNGDFHMYSGVTPGTNGDAFTSVNPTNWSGGSGLIYVTNYSGINNPNLYLPVYGPTPGVPASPSNPFPAPPPGGNFVEADGNPQFGSGFSFQLHGLTPGQTYTLSFFQAGGQQGGAYGNFGGGGLNTTEQWIVGLGTSGFSVNIGAGGPDSYYGGNDSTYSLGDPLGSVAISPLMTTP